VREDVRRKDGTTREGSKPAREKMTALGASLGFDFNYSDEMGVVNTLLAHRLLHCAGTQGRQHDLKMALFSAFFTHRRDVHNPEILADAAAEIGLDRDEALAAIADESAAETVRQHEAFWIQRGVQGVPAMVFDQKYAATGAQGEENYAKILQMVTEGEAA